jgi:hypothetical protein
MEHSGRSTIVPVRPIVPYRRESEPTKTHLHEFLIIYRDPSIPIRVGTSFQIKIHPRGSESEHKYRWKASVNVFTATQALTKRSNVMPGGGPYPVDGPEAFRDCRLKVTHGFHTELTVFLLDKCEEAWCEPVSETT